MVELYLRRGGGTMHAVLVSVSVEAGKEDDGVKFLESDVLPLIRQAPGLVAGYWMAPQGGHGWSVVVFESEEAANAARQMAENGPMPDYAKMERIDVVEVVASV
jgi:hypothetical protein